MEIFAKSWEGSWKVMEFQKPKRVQTLFLNKKEQGWKILKRIGDDDFEMFNQFFQNIHNADVAPLRCLHWNCDFSGPQFPTPLDNLNQKCLPFT